MHASMAPARPPATTALPGCCFLPERFTARRAGAGGRRGAQAGRLGSRRLPSLPSAHPRKRQVPLGHTQVRTPGKPTAPPHAGRVDCTTLLRSATARVLWRVTATAAARGRQSAARRRAAHCQTASSATPPPLTRRVRDDGRLTAPHQYLLRLRRAGDGLVQQGAHGGGNRFRVLWGPTAHAGSGRRRRRRACDAGTAEQAQQMLRRERTAGDQKRAGREIWRLAQERMR
jgi:hypothetical protein